MAVQVRKCYLLGEFELDSFKKTLARNDSAIHLANRPYQVLLYLVENRQRMVTRAELLDLFWEGKDVYENTLTKCVGAIRKALDDNLENPKFIETQWAKGYRYVGPFEDRSSSADEFGQPRASEVTAPAFAGMDVETSVNADTAITTTPTGPVGGTALTKSAARRRFGWRAGVISAAFLLAAMLITAFIWERNPGGSGKALIEPVRSIAVLPLKNLSNDEQQEYFSDGLTETFITELSKIDGLKVISRNSVFTFKGKDVDAREVGRKLGVAAILEGSVRRSGETVRVDVRLVNTIDGSIIWTGNSYDRALNDLLAAQDEIACSVAAGLKVRLCGGADAIKRYTENVDAYQEYLQGRFFWNKRTADGIRRSIEHFEQAIALDPNYALAYAGLADSYVQGIWHVPFTPQEVLPKAKAAALRAVEIDDTLAEAHTALANIHQMEWDWQGTAREIERAIELDPKLARAYHIQAFHWLLMKRYDEALAAIKRAQELDPLNLMINSDLAQILGTSGRHDEAIVQAKKVVELDPGFAQVHTFLSQAYYVQGKDRESADEYLRAKALDGASEAVIAELRKAYKEKGVKGLFRREIDTALKDRLSGKYTSAMYMASYYMCAGDNEEAIKWLINICETRNPEVLAIKVAVQFEGLRADPRLRASLQKTGLPD